MNELLQNATAAVTALEEMLAEATGSVRSRTVVDGRLSSSAVNANQHVAHSLAWTATYVEALRQMVAWATRLEESGRFRETEQLILRIAFSEYVSQIFGGIPMSQGEYARFRELGVQPASSRSGAMDILNEFMSQSNDQALRARLMELMLGSQGAPSVGETGLDEESEEIRDQIRKFAEQKVIPFAQEWHVNDELIPMALVSELSEMGVFGLTVPVEHGGSGMSKIAMCVVSEELSRGYLGVGSLATRSEIAAELVAGGGTLEQKSRWLPGIASGSFIPTAVFTEPGAGSDLGSLRTRAEAVDGGYRITGNKTWITHAGRANLMTLLARTDPESKDYRGLSMFVVEKSPESADDTFPDDAISGTEIPVIGYRGMKEYEIGFDGLVVEGDSLLGGTEGLGFKQLMATFESARIQTAARSVGVAQAALETGLAYATQRSQFGTAIASFPRVAAKLTMAAVEIMICRQLTYFAARQKDLGRRCDLEAGMAKLLAARTAWAAADNCVQIHGGNGFAVESPASRLLCDARILSIFEGAAEIQANVIAGRILQRPVN